MTSVTLDRTSIDAAQNRRRDLPGATLCERLMESSDHDPFTAPAAGSLIPPSTIHTQQPSSSSCSSRHSHIPSSISAIDVSSLPHSISTHTSLNSFPSLTITCPSSPLSSSCPSLILSLCTAARCVATLSLDAHVLSLASAGDYLYGGCSSSSSIHVWLKNDLHKGKHTAQYADASDRSGKLDSLYGDGAVRALAAVGTNRVVSAHDRDNKIRVWKTTRHQLPHRNVAPWQYGMHADPMTSLKLLTTMPRLKDYLKAFLFESNYVQVRRHHKRLWIEHADAISALAVPRDGSELLFSASWDRSIKLWRLWDFKCVQSVRQAHDDAINCLALSPDGKFVYTGSADTKVKVWALLYEAKKGDDDCHGRAKSKSIRLVHSAVSILEGHKSAVNALAVSPDGSVLYSGAGDKAIIVWERQDKSISGSTAHMTRAGVLRGHRNAILCLVTVADNIHDDQRQEEAHLLCSGSADKTIRIWRAVRRSCMQKMERVRFEYRCMGILEGHLGPVRCMSVSAGLSPDDNDNGDDDDLRVHHLLYSASLDTTLKVWCLPRYSFGRAALL